jgi:hypothetical protein
MIINYFNDINHDTNLYENVTALLIYYTVKLYSNCIVYNLLILLKIMDELLQF